MKSHAYLTILLLTVLLTVSKLACANSIVQNGSCELKKQTWYLSANTAVYLGQDPINALKSGITLNLRYEINIRPKDKWLNNGKTIQHRLRLSYNHITQSYQVENPITLNEKNYATIEEALAAIGTLKNLPLIDSSLIADTPPTIRLRLTLEAEQLPVSLRFTALVSKDWNIDSDWWICPSKP